MGLTDIGNGLIGLAEKNPLTTAAGVVGIAVGTGVATGAVVGAIKRRKTKRRKTRNSRKRSYRTKKMHKSRRTKHSKRTSHKKIRYTKNHQPYIILASGKARFISKRSAKQSKKRKGGRY